MLLGGARCLLIGEGLFAAPPWAETLREGDVVLDASSDWFELRPARGGGCASWGIIWELAGPFGAVGNTVCPG